MARIAERAEAEASYRQWAERWAGASTAPPTSPTRITAAITHAAWQAADDADADGDPLLHRSGPRPGRWPASARRPDGRAVAGPAHRRPLTLSWGSSRCRSRRPTSDEMVWFAVETAVEPGYVAHGDIVSCSPAPPTRGAAAADVLRIVRAS